MFVALYGCMTAGYLVKGQTFHGFLDIL